MISLIYEDGTEKSFADISLEDKTEATFKIAEMMFESVQSHDHKRVKELMHPLSEMLVALEGEKEKMSSKDRASFERTIKAFLKLNHSEGGAIS